MINENTHPKKIEKIPGISKSEQLKKHLLMEIEQMLLKKEQTLDTEQELMLRYSVSRQTVRKVLKELISEGYLYSRQGSGTYLTGKSPDEGKNVVEILMATPDDYIFPELIATLRQKLGTMGFRISLTETGGDFYSERKCLESFIKNPPRAIISECFSSFRSPNLDLYSKLQRSGTSLLFLYGIYPNFPAWSTVKDDNYSGAYSLVQNLVRRGHSSFAGIFVSDSIQGQERFAGYIDALRDLDLNFSRSHILMLNKKDFNDLLNPSLKIRLMDFTKDVLYESSALVCFNDEVAYRLLPILTKLQIRVPDDLSIVSFDDSYLSQIEHIRITSLSHEKHSFSDAVAASLTGLLSDTRAETVVVPWTLTEGNSVEEKY
ncbi:GntR family transcriptional regulator [Oribacterium sp. WCC10]|uniref:GntR family transcriptional regulator n=1 Tax=Oribacterium sp. WCC10 TaxID=1855343 RepID=UPI0008F19DFC|nr:GntR family transcriptional regulator [Oribacterium sp. WCC10]SFG30534.1 GntR family transcriptional regulator, arabinose operon transcriptional repressor [Oribacterium sp. WCC10]